ncbi:hypothetical protein [Streptomyces sp. NPDC057939]|uniref:hypothetical protein n=1 Tax=Streptomyces sp. NPDC057939 TaxID=3346284 RepID=UPI0036DFFED3
MTIHDGEARESRTPEPELPAKVPENEDALTPDLPPRFVEAPDLWDGEADGPVESRGEPREGSREEANEEPREEAGEGVDRPAEPKDPKPQEATD